MLWQNRSEKAEGAGVESLADVDAVVLAGGLGTRIRTVLPDRPKVLAEVAGRPFLAHLLDHLVGQGLRRAILCTGYLGDQVESAFGQQHGVVELVYARESAPLGTGGALRGAASLLRAATCLVVNGDSLCAAPLQPMLDAHRGTGADATLLLTAVEDASRYGAVDVDARGRIAQFAEKGRADGGLVSAGVYLLARRLIDSIPTGRTVSLEREMFPRWVGPAMHAHICNDPLMDIGVPSGLAMARAAAAGAPV